MLAFVTIAVILGLALAFRLGFSRGRQPKRIKLSEPERKEVARLRSMYPDHNEVIDEQPRWRDQHKAAFLDKNPEKLVEDPPTANLLWPFTRSPFMKKMIGDRKIIIAKPNDDPTPGLTPEKKV